MKNRIAQSWEQIIPAWAFKKSAHAPAPADLLAYVKQYAPETVQTAATAENPDAIYYSEIKFACLGDLLLLYSEIYDLADGLEFSRVLAHLANEILVYARTDWQNEKKFWNAYSRKELMRTQEFLPAENFNCADNAFSNRKFSRPGNRKFPRLSLLNADDFKLARFKKTSQNVSGADTDQQIPIPRVNLVKKSSIEQKRAQIESTIKTAEIRYNQLQSQITVDSNSIFDLNREIGDLDENYTIANQKLTADLDNLVGSEIVPADLQKAKSLRSNVLNKSKTILSWAESNRENKRQVDYYMDRKEKAKTQFGKDNDERNSKPWKEKYQSTKNRIIAALTDIEITVTLSGGDDEYQLVADSINAKIAELNAIIDPAESEFNKQKQNTTAAKKSIEAEIAQSKSAYTKSRAALVSRLDQISAKNKQNLDEIKKIEFDLDALNEQFSDLENELAELADEIVLQDEVEKIKKLYEQKLADFDKNAAELNASRDTRYKTLKNETESLHVEKMGEIERAAANYNTNIEKIKEQRRIEMQNLQNQMKQDLVILSNQNLNQEEEKAKTREIQQIHTNKVREADQKYDDLLTIEKMVVDKLKSDEQIRWDDSMKKLREIENESAELAKQRQKIIDEQNFSIQDILSDANEQTPVNLSYWGFLTRILRNIDHYSARVREILPDSTFLGVSRFRSQILSEPEAFIVCDFISIAVSDGESPGRYISDVLVPPLGNRDFTITIKRTKKESEQITDSVLNSSSESVTNSLTNTIETRNNQKIIKSSEQDKLNRRTENLDLNASGTVPIQAVPINASAGYKSNEENENRIRNNNSKETFAEELKNCISANTATVNQTRELKQENVKIVETTEETQSTERITFSNPNPVKSIKLKFYQADQIFKIGTGIDKISLIFANGFKQFTTEIPQIGEILDLLDDNVEFNTDGLKDYIFRFCSVTDVSGTVFNFCNRDLSLNRIPKYEGFTGVVLTESFEKLLLDKVTTVPDLSPIVMADEVRQAELNEHLDKLKKANQMTSELIRTKSIKNNILDKLYQSIDSTELDFDEISRLLLLISAEGMDLVQKPLLLSHLNRSERENDCDFMIADKYKEKKEK